MKFEITFGTTTASINVNNTALAAAIVDYNTWYTIRDNVYWGNDVPNDIKPIWGDEAIKAAEEDGVIIGGAGLLAECQYVFRIGLGSGKLIPLRVTMHPKTAANIVKGSRRFGSSSIYAEIC